MQASLSPTHRFTLDCESKVVFSVAEVMGMHNVRVSALRISAKRYHRPMDALTIFGRVHVSLSSSKTVEMMLYDLE